MKWQQEQEDILKVVLVLIAEDYQPIQQWITGRVVEPQADADDRVAADKSRTQATYKKAVNKLDRLALS